MKSPAWAAAGASGAAAVGIALAAAALGTMFSAVTPPAFSIAAAEAIAASGAIALLGWRSPRLAIGAAVGTMFALVPNEIFGCINALTGPLAATDGRTAHGDLGFVFMGVLVLFLGSVTSFPFAALAYALRRRAVHVALGLAAIATLASALVTVGGLASMRRPEPDDFAEVFDRVSTLDGGQHVVLDETAFDYERDPAGTDTCTLRLTGDTATLGAQLVATENGCPELRVLRDPRGEGMVVLADFAQPLAIFGTKNRRAEIRPADIAPSLGAPRAWTFGAAVGFVLAGFALFAAFRASRARRAVQRALDATHLGDGWIKLGDAKRHIASLAAAPEGPVVVTQLVHSRGATYRDDGSPHALAARPGTRQMLRDEIATRAVAWSCVTIATVAMTSAPLWIARLCGLL